MIDWHPKPHRGLSYLFAAFLGLACAFYVIPVDLLLGRPPASFFFVDRGQHYLGNMFYLHEGWSRNFLSIRSVDPDHAVPVAFFDSVPAFSLLMKAWNSCFPHQFIQSMDLFLALSFVLQPICAVFVMRSMGEKRFFPGAIAAGMASFCQMFLEQTPVNQIGLSSQWMLLLAIGLYFRATRGSKGWRCAFLFFPLICLSFYVHPYNTVMLCIVAATLPLSLICERRSGLDVLGASLIVAAAFLATGVEAYYSGFVGARGVGLHYGMSPFKLNYIFRMHSFMPIGVLGGSWVLLIAFIVRRTAFKGYGEPDVFDWKKFAANNGAIILMGAGCMFYALSGKLKLGHAVLLRWGTSWIPLHNVLRCGDRFYIIPAYFLLFGLIAYWARRPKSHWLLSTALIIQFLSGMGALHHNRVIIRHFAKGDIPEQVPAGISKISIMLAYSCLPGNGFDDRDWQATSVERAIYQAFLQNPDVRLDGNMYLARYPADRLCRMLDIPMNPPAQAYQKSRMTILTGPFARIAATAWSAKGLNCYNGKSYNAHGVYLCHNEAARRERGGKRL